MKIQNIFQCLRCNSTIKLPTLTLIQKDEIKTMMKTAGKLSTITYLSKITGLDIGDSKAVIMHLNNYGHCVRCENKNLIAENVVCPKCKSFNLNWQ